MKRILIFLLSLLVVGVSAQDYCMTAPIGFGRNATGGAGGAVVTVGTQAALQTALTSSGAKIIIVTQDITFTSMISATVTNKTLLGLNGVKLIQPTDNGIIGFASNSNNVIIRNLIFEGPSAYDIDGHDLLENTNCNNLWVDHCEFYDGLDGNFDNTKKADNITISWCKFGYKKPPRAGGSGGSNNHRFSNLVGGSKTDAPADQHYSITFMFNHWSEGCVERMPRARNAELHILNCFYNSSVTSRCIGLGGGSYNTTCYIEGCVFALSGSNSVIYTSYISTDGGTVSLNYVDIVANKSYSNIGTVSAPTYPYTAIPAADVEVAILSPCGAGATLNVDLQGNVSCGTTAVNTPKSETFDYTIEGNYLKINDLDVEKITVYDIQGKKLISAAKNKINISSLGKGIYMFRAKTKNEGIVSGKIML